jgi:hypothetical protein
MSVPKAKARPQITFIFDLPDTGLQEQDVGKMLSSFEFKGMVNGGYVVKGKLVDPNFNMLNLLIDSGYFAETRTRPVPVIFQIRWGPKAETQFPESATKRQIAYLLSLRASGQSADKAVLEFIALDPPSWFLNMGDASGGAYTGRASDAIRQVVNQYAPKVKLDISKTTDSEQGKWWMMRQDPKTFISSIFDWSASITRKQTQWVFAPDGMNLVIKEQAELISKQRGFYRFMELDEHDTIRNWEFLADNALSTVETKLVTQGISAISGQYLDRITDKNEDKVFIKDSRTPNKKIANIKDDQGFKKPPDAKPQEVGWSSVTTIPEIYSAGDLGLRYEEYIDGRPRAMWLNLVNALMRVKIECVGHGEWSSCEGLGVDTAFIKWTTAKKGSGPDKPYWWMSGNWLVYGFHHRVNRGFWFTDLYLARFDHDASAKKVGGSGGT